MSIGANEAFDTRSLTERVYGVLLNEILSGRLAPNTQIDIDEIGRRLQISRTPIKESLSRLAAEGLVDIGSNLFAPGPNSGTPVVGEPQELGAGRIVGGSLELSNVDLSQEFINLILASTGYSAASRVITTTDQLMQQLLVLGR